jgi:hypothetical protein
MTSVKRLPQCLGNAKAQERARSSTKASQQVFEMHLNNVSIEEMA